MHGDRAGQEVGSADRADVTNDVVALSPCQGSARGRRALRMALRCALAVAAWLAPIMLLAACDPYGVPARWWLAQDYRSKLPFGAADRAYAARRDTLEVQRYLRLSRARDDRLYRGDSVGVAAYDDSLACEWDRLHRLYPQHVQGRWFDLVELLSYAKHADRVRARELDRRLDGTFWRAPILTDSACSVSFPSAPDPRLGQVRRRDTTLVRRSDSVTQ